MDTNQRERDRRMEYMCGNYYCTVHVIRSGDTLYRLSRQYGVKVSALMMANPFVDIYNLRIGDELCIPRAGRPADMPEVPVRPMPENTTQNTTHMMSEEACEKDERVINIEMPEMNDDRMEES